MGTTTATFAGPGSTPPMSVDGTNTIVIPGVCSPGATPPVAGIGVGGGAGLGNISGANVLPLPGAQQVTVAANLQTIANLETLAQTIETSADVFRVGPQTQAILPPTMSPTNPVTIAVDGDLDLSTWTGTGYGVLLVTGTLRYDPSSTWNGIVLRAGDWPRKSDFDGCGWRQHLWRSTGGANEGRGRKHTSLAGSGFLAGIGRDHH